MQPVWSAVGDGFLWGGKVGFAHSIAFVVVIQQCPHFLQERHHVRLVDIVDVTLAVEGAQPEFWGVIQQVGMFEVGIEDIQAEPVNSMPQPEAENFQLCVAHLRVAPIDIRLLLREQVQVILTGGWVDTPMLSRRRRPASYSDGPARYTNRAWDYSGWSGIL